MNNVGGAKRRSSAVGATCTGFNYCTSAQIDGFHARASDAADRRHGRREHGLDARRSTRTTAAQGYVSAYDRNAPAMGRNRRGVVVSSTPRGRCSPAGSSGPASTIAASRRRTTWPCISSHFGILDTCGFPKDIFYYYQAWWTTSPCCTSSRTGTGRAEGQEIEVWAYTNCDEVELFLNGTSLGDQEVKRTRTSSGRCRTRRARSKRDGLRRAGKQVLVETDVETTGAAARIRARAGSRTIRADGEDCRP